MDYVIYLVTLLVPAYSSFLVMRIGYYCFVERVKPKTSLLLLFLPAVSALWILVGFRAMARTFFYPDNFRVALVILAASFLILYFHYIGALWRLSEIHWARRAAYRTMVWVTLTTAIFYFQIVRYW